MTFYVRFHRLIGRIRRSGIARRMARGMFWLLIGTVLAKLIVLISGIICARLLGKSGYGELGIVRSTVMMFVALGSAGIGLTATKYIAEFKGSDTQKAASVYGLSVIAVFVTGIVVAAIIVISAPQIAEKLLNAPYLTNEIRIGSLWLFVTILNSVQNGALAGFEDFKAIAINMFIASIVEAIFMNIGAFYYGVPGAVLGFGIGYIVHLILNYISAIRDFRKNDIHIGIKYVSKKHIRILYTFSLPAAMSGILVALALWFTKSMLAKKAGFGEAGLFEAADQWRIFVLFIPGMLAQVLLPILSNVKNEENNQFWKVVKYNVLINGAVSLLLASGVGICGKYIMSLYGAEFTNTLPIILLAFSCVLFAPCNAAWTGLASYSKMWLGLFLNGVWGIIVICASYIFINNGMGAVGLALAILCAYIIHAINFIIYFTFRYTQNRGIKNT
ncbi:hypothetical protein FACS1894147_09430 [Spirochaetia bacterium]|nr:hypothetical protein FACS1894147_09430 [Spirochaetia bacterium]